MTQKVLVTPSSNIVHCNWHTQKPICAYLEAYANAFSLCKLTFFSVFCQGELRKQPNFTCCWFWLGKMHRNCLSGVYLGFEACQMQCHRFWVSVISSSWKITISGKNFTFGWFWQGKMHQNGLSGAYLGFKACQIQWHLLWVYLISGSWKITILGDA